jgi:hypothetical protein
MLEPTRFHPFFISLKDNFSIPIGDFEREHLIAAPHLFVVMDRDGNLMHVPYTSISHIDYKDQLNFP